MERIEKDEGLPIYYFTNGVVKVWKDCVMVDGRVVFRIMNIRNKPRGYRSELSIYDDSVSDKVAEEVIEPMLRGRMLLVKDTRVDKEN